MSKSSHLNVSNRHETVSFTSAFTDRPNSADHSAFLVSLGPCLGKSEIMNKQLKRHVQYLNSICLLVSITFYFPRWCNKHIFGVETTSAFSRVEHRIADFLGRPLSQACKMSLGIACYAGCRTAIPIILERPRFFLVDVAFARNPGTSRNTDC